MVFESVIVDLMNRYLGDFIENLDRSQLKLGIWGGDVVLNNLYIKDSALDDLDLPVKILHGNLGKLTLKIPWKNLYGAPTIASLEGLYLVAVPQIGVKYNEEKEKKSAWESKQKELQRIEDAKKAEAEKNKPKDPKADSFAEKLASNIIKNLQIEISDIHVRYEDRFTNPSKPFSIGVTLKGLSFQTTDEHWTPKIIKESVMKIYKMIKLDSLALYWNSNSPSYVGLDKEQMLQSMKGNIIGMGQKTTYSYLIEPICSSAQLQLHTKPEQDSFSIPKILLGVVMEQIGISLQRNQYLDLMEMLESFERLNLSAKYRKFRPDVQKRGQAKRWWHFAYNCVLDVQVHRRRKMWSWSMIQKHRQMCKEYKATYKKRLGMKKVTKEIQDKLEEFEKELSVFNITLMRQQAELERKWEKKAKHNKKHKKKEKAKKEGIKPGGEGGGWFGGWLGWGKKADKGDKEDKDLGAAFQDAMTADEKAKMYAAIGYQESAVDPTLPKEFVATKIDFQLKNLKLSLKDPQLRDPQIMNLQLSNMAAYIGQRPAASAVKVDTTIESFSMSGAVPISGGPPPTMVSSQTVQENQKLSLLDAEVETNPLDGSCDTRLKLNARPLEIIYDAQTIILIADFFKPPESVHLTQLQAAAMAKFEEIKEETATGLQHAIEQRKYTEITVNIKPTHFIMPDRGVYRKDCKMLVLDLGQFSINTEKQNKEAMSPTLSFDEVTERAYDKFRIQLSAVQLFFANPGDDWKAQRSLKQSPLHILRPMHVNIDLNKCMIQDPRIPKMKILGELPKLDVTMSDTRLQDVVHLLQSVPFPEGSPPAPDDPLASDAPDLTNMAVEGNAQALVKKLQTDDDSDEFFDAPETATPAKIQRQKSSDYINMTNLLLKFEIKEICVTLSQRRPTGEVPMVKLVIDSLGTEVKVCTMDLSVSAYLGGIYLQHMQFKAESGGPLVNLINTPITDETTFKLLTVEYLKANKKGPEFQTAYNNTEQKIRVNFSALEVLLHQEAILSLMAFAQTLQPEKQVPPGDQIVAEVAGTAMAAPPGGQKPTEGEDGKAVAKSRKKKEGPEVIDIAVEANLDVFSLAVCTEKQLLTDIKIKGLQANVTVQKSKTDVVASLKDITVFDPTPTALYPKILAFEDEEVFRIGIVAYNGATDGDNYCNMQAVDLSVDLNSGCMKVVFLNKFVMNLLTFLNQFQIAKDKMAEAGAAAAESAAKAATELSDKATRISLQIKMKAPVIIVPQSSMSSNALIVDLGKINIANRFEIVGKRNAQGFPAVLDKMSVELTALKLSRALMLGTEQTAECTLLEPMSLRIDLMRNLAASWYHGHPDIDVSGKLRSFGIGISQGDFTSIMSVLNENLNEGQAAAPVTAPPAVPGPAGETIRPEHQSTVSATPASQQQKQLQASQVQSQSVEVWSKVKFSFTIEGIRLELYNGDSGLSSGYSERDPKQSLGRIQLQALGLCGNIKSSGAIEASVMLYKCVLDDTRPGRENGITKMVEHSSQVATAADPPNMIQLIFKQSANQNKDVDIQVTGLYICVCLEYLMALGDFFTKGMPQDTTPKPAIKPATADVTTAHPQPAPAPAAVDNSEMSVCIVIDKPEIVMVENPLLYDTNALILDVQVVFELKKSSEMMYAKGTVSGLQIVSCIYSPEKRDSTRSLILNPVDITLFSKDYIVESEHRVDITVTDVILNISPTSIRTITATLSSLSPPPVEETKEILHGIPNDLWETKKYADFNFWFLKPVTADVVNGTRPAASELPAVIKDEQLIMQVNSITVKLEGGVGRRTVPFITTQMTFTAEVRDWTSRLSVGAELSLEVAYYNEMMACWEPIIEPVEEEGHGYRPWELKLKLSKHGADLEEEFLEEDPNAAATNPIQMAIEIRSADVLETTLTKACLEVLTNLGKSFGDAYKLVEVTEKAQEVTSPYLIKNESGIDITIKPDDSFRLGGPKGGNKHVPLCPGDHLELYDQAAESGAIERKKSLMHTSQDEKRKVLYLVMEEYGATRELKVLRAEKVVFNINQRAYPGDVQQLVCQTDASYGCKTVLLRSILQVKNHLPFAVELYYKLSDDCKGRCGECPPDKTFSVPMEAVYSAPYELYFKPTDNRYLESVDSFKWKDLASGSKSVICCEPSKKTQDSAPLFFNVEVEVEDIFFEATGEKTAKSYTLNFYPAAVFRNLLPLPVTLSTEGCTEELVIEGGDRKQLMHAKPGHSKVIVKMAYHNKQWVCNKQLEEKPNEMSVWSFEATEDGQPVTMDLGIHTAVVEGSPLISLYCPYWMINKTGRDLSYKSGDDFVVTHPTDHQGAVLFSFKSKSFFAQKKKEEVTTDADQLPGKKGNSLKRKTSSRSAQKPSKSKATLKKGIKASLKLPESEWSDKFSLDTVGSAGTISCKFKGLSHTSDLVEKSLTKSAALGLTIGLPKDNKIGVQPSNKNHKSIKAKIGVKISLGSSGLTKIVTFTPYVMLINQAKFTITCRENITESPWFDVVPGECMPYWPTQTEKKMQMIAKVKDNEQTTTPFYFNQPHVTLLKLNNEYGGINVECQVMESAVNVVFQQYHPGYATARIINHTTNAEINFYQTKKDVKDPPRATLAAGDTIMYNWDNPLDKRELIWSCGDKKNQKTELLKDDQGNFLFSADYPIYWLSFLDGMQRTLLFTDDLQMVLKIEQADLLEMIDQEITIALNGLGLSLVNNFIHKEVAYISITSSGAMWEEKKKKKRYKALKGKYNLALEEAWTKYRVAMETNMEVASRVELENGKLIVDFKDMQMTKPHKNTIRRQYQDGLWLQYRDSKQQTMFHVKVNRFQLDNQIPGAVFPTVLAPIPPPKSVAAESDPKPFTEVSIMIRKREFSNVMQFKYFKVLVQEMAVKIDQGFLGAVITLFSSGKIDKEQERIAFTGDCDQVNSKLMDLAVQSSAQEQKHYYDQLHFSPLKVHLSFSMTGSSGDEDFKIQQTNFNILGLFLQSVGIVLTDIDDVVFKLGFFERNFMFYNQSQLTKQITIHYSQQAIKQMYVLVLGLDVLGNPFGLIRGLAEGIEDLFYEPYQGAVQGPEEFAEGLALGVRSLFGHAVGGAAGAVSRMTGALGKGIASLTMDDDYQRKRREQLNKKPADLKEGLARGGKGLVMGVFDGVTGIVRKPMEGAKQDGAAGFFKGVGKGMIGVVTRPASGVVDFASSSFEGIKRVAEMGDEVRRIRPPRYLQTDGIVRAYNYREAEGNEILADIDKGKYMTTDSYVAHIIVTKDLKNVFVITDKQLIFASKGEIFGHWDTDWHFTWDELKEVPNLTTKGIQVLLKDKKFQLMRTRVEVVGEKEKQKKSFFSTGTVGKLIPILDKKKAEWILKKIQTAMTNAK